ncbi:MAG: HlyD family efflux transporter periplasmic adaptor subunit [Oscillospiraceae bacterium]|nr:HlyD family efflux transporter periplasmic adaptor subunit [Oscillospiraceae bacterium]
MDFKPKNREWVKNAAIIFLAVLLVLTFFSNTWMNRSLPEVATQYVTDGSITAKVRGTGTVTANGAHQVKAEQTREIRAVMIKVGQEVKAGDVLFVLGEGDSAEIEAAQEALRALQVSYQRAAVGVSKPDYSAAERKLKLAEIEMNDAAQAVEEAKKNIPSVNLEEIQAAEEALAQAEAQLQAAIENHDKALQAALDRVNAAQAEVDRLTEELSAGQTVSPDDPDAPEDPGEGGASSTEEELQKAKQELSDAKLALEVLNNTTDPAVAAATTLRDQCQAKLTALSSVATPETEAYKAALEAYRIAEDNYYTLKEALEQQKAADKKAQQLSNIDLADLAAQIERARQKLAELTGGEDNEITARVSGTVQSVDCTAGDTKLKDDVLCTIEVPDMGYTLSFSVTNEQARRLRPGDTATVSNYYWGSQITATLNTIQVDPKNPQNNKLLTFDVDGDVNTGAELTLSVGQKSANYDVIVPNSAIRSDSNGSFVLAIEARNSPLGNRYVARRVNVEVLASDDMNSAVTADLHYGDYVITTSNAPVKNGDLVRLADA